MCLRSAANVSPANHSLAAICEHLAQHRIQYRPDYGWFGDIKAVVKQDWGVGSETEIANQNGQLWRYLFARTESYAKLIFMRHACLNGAEWWTQQVHSVPFWRKNLDALLGNKRATILTPLPPEFLTKGPALLEQSEPGSRPWR